MGLGLHPEDLQEDEKILFEKGEETKFVCLDTFENKTRENILLKCKVLSGPHQGKLTTLFISQKRTHAHFIRKLRDFAKAFYTDAELRAGTTELSRLVTRVFTAIPQEAREYQGRWYQDMTKWHDLGLIEEQTTAVYGPHQQVDNSTIPF